MPKEDSQLKEEDSEQLPTRDKITGVALEVFAEKGLHGATMAEIAKRAGLTGGALYRYFENKEEIFQAVVEEHSVAFTALDMVRGLLPELEPRTALKFIMQGMFLFFFSERDFMRVVVGESLKDPSVAIPFFDKMLGPTHEFVSECIELWRERGLVKDEVQTHVATIAFLGMLGFFLVEQAFLYNPEVSEFNADEMAEQFATMFLDGILKSG